jgi:hypothetical protein
MQTFLPYEDFAASAAVLDNKRLGKQRVETLQVMKSLTVGGGLHGGWSKHPASRMWAGHLSYLMEYQEACVAEWTSRRSVNTGEYFKDTCLEKTADFYTSVAELEAPDDRPWFLGHAAFHLAHRSNLIRKDREFYLPMFGNLPDDLEYIWTEPK